MIIDELIENLVAEHLEELSKLDLTPRERKYIQRFITDLTAIQSELKDANEEKITFNTNEIEKDVAIRVLSEMVAEK